MSDKQSEVKAGSDHKIVPWKQALERMREGNARFVTNVRSMEAMTTTQKRDALVNGQYPFATILSCSDSRVPSELVFDLGLGDLFVVRVAGNVVAPSIIGSVEFAVESLGTQLVVVMGHTQCGAIKATVDSLANGGLGLSTNLRDLVSRISPAVANLLNTGLTREQLISHSARANVRSSVNQLRHSSRSFEDKIAEGTLAIVGAEYSLETGQVDFFDL